MSGFLRILVLVVVAGIAVAQKVEVEGKAWLDQYSSPASINVNGTWHSPDWGRVFLNQADGSREVTGNGDGWRINGVVSGDSVYLLFSDKGKVNYCAELKAESATSLKGQYSSGMMKPKAKLRPMVLTKQ